MPMRWVEADRDVLNGLAGSDSDQRYGALASLHLAMARKYLVNGDDKRSWWADKPINVLYGIGEPDADSSAIAADTSALRDQQVRFTTLGINNLQDLSKNNNKETLAWLAEPIISSQTSRAAGSAEFVSRS